MAEGAVGERPHGVLADPGEEHVAKLREGDHHHPPDAVGDDQERGHDGETHERGAAARGARARRARQPVYGRLVRQRHRDRDDLRGNQRDEGGFGTLRAWL